MKITNLNEHKNKKKYEKVVRDITGILSVLTLTQRGLAVFKHYVSVQEIISTLETNKVLLELQKKKYEKELEKLKDK
jgi:hypothetical protein